MLLDLWEGHNKINDTYKKPKDIGWKVIFPNKPHINMQCYGDIVKNMDIHTI